MCMKLINKLQYVIEGVAELQDKLVKFPKFLKLLKKLVKEINASNKDDLPVENFFKEWLAHEKDLKKFTSFVLGLSDDEYTKAKHSLNTAMKEYNNFKKTPDYEQFLNFLKSDENSGNKLASRILQNIIRLDGVINRFPDLLEA